VGCGRYTTALLRWESQSAHSHSLTHSLTFTLTHSHSHSLTHPHCQLTTYLFPNSRILEFFTHSLTFTHFHSHSLTYPRHQSADHHVTSQQPRLTHLPILPPPHSHLPTTSPHHFSPPLPTHQMCIFPNFPYVEIITKSETGLLQYTSAAMCIP